MNILGITGGIGSGKSVVSQLLRTMNIPVYSADNESKSLLNSSLTLKSALIKAFGEQLYFNGSIDKGYFASLIFTDPQKLAIANQIIHPFVKDDFINWIEMQKKNQIIGIETAILFESKFDILVDKTILVYSPIKTRIERTMLRDNATEAQILNRMKNQILDEEKLEKADYIIKNDKHHSLISQLNQIINKVLA